MAVTGPQHLHSFSLAGTRCTTTWALDAVSRRRTLVLVAVSCGSAATSYSLCASSFWPAALIWGRHHSTSPLGFGRGALGDRSDITLPAVAPALSRNLDLGRLLRRSFVPVAGLCKTAATSLRHHPFDRLGLRSLACRDFQFEASVWRSCLFSLVENGSSPSQESGLLFSKSPGGWVPASLFVWGFTF
jgi:hypothetical protein